MYNKYHLGILTCHVVIESFGELRVWLNSLCGDCDGQVVRHGETRTEVNRGWIEKEGVKESRTVKRREMEDAGKRSREEREKENEWKELRSDVGSARTMVGLLTGVCG
jgi:hypothetical protein